MVKLSKTRILGRWSFPFHLALVTAIDQINSEMIFDVAKTIAYLSQGTTLEKGTVILTGTGPGIGFMRKPKIVLTHRDEMRVRIENIGTLINKVYHE